jgi:predicted ATP-dependent endonuclease of OLD family
LASSLRVVRSDKTEQTSVIESALWTDGKVGVLPLYVAMGASALAMSAVRNAVYVEGGSDCTLLPAIVNSAVPQRSLGFMTLPGVAQVATDLLGNLSNEASQIAFVLDGDADGDDYEKALLKAGYPKECIIRLPEGHVIEDLVDIKLYTSGVTRALAVNSVKAPEMPSSAIGSTNRPEKLKKWCLENGIEPPSKVAVAAEIVHVARLEGRGIVAPDHLDTVKRLSERLSSWFQKNSERRVNSK